jgi:hypothetical protein
MAFDSEDELIKIASISTFATLFLRLHAEDKTSLVRLGDKFGAHASEARTCSGQQQRWGLKLLAYVSTWDLPLQIRLHIPSRSRCSNDLRLQPATAVFAPNLSH